MADDGALRVSVHIEAPPEVVFRYFTDPARYVQWMGADAVLDPVPGGTYRVRMGNGMETTGTFLEVEAPWRVAFTFGWAHDPEVPPGSTRVVVTLAPEDRGTRVVLAHHGLPGGAQADHHRRGWELHLGRLAVAAAGGDPGPDPNG